MKILIEGDSWGRGEWDGAANYNYGVRHTGLQYFLEQNNHVVTNNAGSGSSNSKVYNRLSKITENFDIIFIFVTDTHRDLKLDQAENFWNFLYIDEYLERHNHLLKHYITQLNSLDIGPLKLLGGLSKLNKNTVTDTKIEIAIPSILELIVPGSTQFDIFFEDYLHKLNGSFLKRNKSLLKDIYNQASKWKMYWKEPIMIPDTVHPNRHGHYEIFKSLKLKYNL